MHELAKGVPPFREIHQDDSLYVAITNKQIERVRHVHFNDEDNE